MKCKERRLAQPAVRCNPMWRKDLGGTLNKDCTETLEMNRGGRPRLPVDADAVAQLRTAGHSWRAIARQIGAGYGTVRRAHQRRAKTVPKPILVALLLALGLLSPATSYGQGGVPVSPINILDSLGRPRPGVTVTICTSAAVGTPCTPLASIFVDAGLTTPAPNPQTTDGQGNVPVFYVSPGVYKYSVTGQGIVGSLFTATVAGTGGGNVLSGSPNTFTGQVNNFNGPGTSALNTGIVPDVT